MSIINENEIVFNMENIKAIKEYLLNKNEIKKGESEMKKLIEDIVKLLVDKPEEVSVVETRGEQISIIEIKVAPDDISKIIGREGRIAISIRNIAKAIAGKNKEKVMVVILDQKVKSIPQ